jgi:hypothetical protein
MDQAPPATAPTCALPEVGTLTVLFTDVEGSSPLWAQREALPPAWRQRHLARERERPPLGGGRAIRLGGGGDTGHATPKDGVS